MRRAAARSRWSLAVAFWSRRRRSRAPRRRSRRRPTRWVTDRAAFLSPATAADLDARLGDYARRTGHQVLVYIDHTTGGVPIEDWGVRAFERWRVGRSGIDDGLVLLVFADDHRVRFEVGYGLEDRVPDAVAKRIIEEQIVPRIRAGDRDGAIRAGVGAVTAAIGGARRHGAGRGRSNPRAAPVPVWMQIVGGVVFLLFIGFVVTHPSLAWLMLLSIGSAGAAAAVAAAAVAAAGSRAVAAAPAAAAPRGRGERRSTCTGSTSPPSSERSARPSARPPARSGSRSARFYFWGDVRRAAERAFARLRIDRTREHNGVLIFVAPWRRRFAILGDEGIHRRVEDGFWDAIASRAGTGVPRRRPDRRAGARDRGHRRASRRAFPGTARHRREPQRASR